MAQSSAATGPLGLAIQDARDRVATGRRDRNSVAIARPKLDQETFNPHNANLVLRQARIYGYLRIFLAPDSFLARGIPSRSLLKAPLLLLVWGLPHRAVAPRQEPKVPRSYTRIFGLDGTLGVGTADGRYEVILWGRNLADKRTNTLVFDSVFRSSSLHTWVNPPGAFGLTPKAQLR